MFTFPTAALIAVLASGPADTPKKEAVDTAGAKKLAEKAIAAFEKGGVTALLDEVAGEDTVLDKTFRPTVEPLFTRLTEEATARYGKVSGGYELLRTKMIGKSVVQFTYLEKRQRVPMVWHLKFCRGEDAKWRWLVIDISDESNSLLKPANLDADDFKAAGTMAAEGVAALKKGGVAGLFDVVFVPGKSILAGLEETADERTRRRAAAVAEYEGKRLIQGAGLGKPIGEFELVQSMVLGQSVIKVVYLEKHERGPIAWEFVFYRTGKDWMWQSVSVTGDMNSFLAREK